MSNPAELIRDAAAGGDFTRAAQLWKKFSRDLDLAQLPELIDAIRQSAADVRAHAWVAEAYRPYRPKRP